MRPIRILALLVILSAPALAQEATDRTILVSGKDGNVLTQIHHQDDIPLRLTDQLGQSFALRAADPAEGFIELIDDRGESVVLGRDAGVWAKRLHNQETKNLITTIIFQVAKGIAIVVALLILRAIIKSIGEGVESEQSRAELLKQIGELEIKLADKEVEMARLSRAH